MKTLKLRSYKYNDKVVKVDDDIYEQLKDKKLHYSRHMGGDTIRIYNGPGISTTNINSIILGEFNPFKVKPVYLDGDFFNRTRENIVLQIRGDIDRKRDTAPYYGNCYKGVSYDKSKSKYIVYLTLGCKTVYLKRYNDPVSAAKVYDAAMGYIFGRDNVHINLPDIIPELPGDIKDRIDTYLETGKIQPRSA